MNGGITVPKISEKVRESLFRMSYWRGRGKSTNTRWFSLKKEFRTHGGYSGCSERRGGNRAGPFGEGGFSLVKVGGKCVLPASFQRRGEGDGEILVTE